MKEMTELQAVSIIDMSWTKERILNDPRIVDIIVSGLIGSNATKSDLIAAYYEGKQ